jgi:hypothetical protein
VRAIQEHRTPNAQIVPFGAQGKAPHPLRAWPVHHHQEPLISVIIPVGPGHAKYLTDALDSVQAQTLPDWECIVVNDTGAALDLTAHPWARQIHEYSGSAGAGAARNLGLRRARAPLTVFLDADDILIPNALEEMVQAYIDSDGKYIYGDWVHLEDESRLDGSAVLHYTPEYDAELWLQGAQHAVTCLLPTDDLRRLGGFDEQLPAWEDWDLLIQAGSQRRVRPAPGAAAAGVSATKWAAPQGRRRQRDRAIGRDTRPLYRSGDYELLRRQCARARRGDLRHADAD